MNLDIDHLAITLQGVAPDMGEQVAAVLGGVLSEHLGELAARAAGPGVAHLDLGSVCAPAGADAQALSALIAARLVDALKHGQATAAAPGEAS